MSKIDSVLVELESYNLNAQICKDLILERLEKDKVITNKQAREYSEKWQVIVVKPTWFKVWMNKFRKDSKENYEYKLVKFED